MPVAQYLEAREGEKPLGVYALYDASRNLQYVGYGRNIILAVKVSPYPILHSRGNSGRLGQEHHACARAASVLLRCS